MKDLIPTIGIEVHVELKTDSKVFSSSLNRYGEVANTNVTVIDLGYPGTLPVINKKVIDLALKAALTFNCKIQKEMYFDRKNYFYPDLPKGYQITQSITPIGYDGYIEIDVDGIKKRIGIERVHIEEDTAKSTHGKDGTLLDFNRAGVPLIEIVSLPVIENEREAVLYLEKLKELLLYTEVSDVKIEEGSLRCDANISLRERTSDILGTKTEIKNIGSISNVKQAILYEIERQTIALNSNEVLKEETRRFDEKNNSTILMRTKETLNDYRYFPEPDIPSIHITDEWINNIKATMPLLPDELRSYYNSLGINDIAIKALIQDKTLSHFLNEVLTLKSNPVISANLLTGDVLAYLNKNNISINETKLNINNFNELVSMLEKEVISSKIGKDILNDLVINGGDVQSIINSKGISQISDNDVLLKIVKEVINSNLDSIKDYQERPDRAIKYLMGQVMKDTKGQANPKIVNEILISELNKY
ncbi:MAG: Asp-tRNA(Asn)/Glu-tRNA(Gln) amidotransferase subunit GatB [Bacilli bacterium]|nr:Asp-tRNA(Asn)/Glu-tRNA(Gln) amidotransferase subunit GatB [Bacilli bacterium]